MKYNVVRYSLEFSQTSRTYKEFLHLETDEEKQAFIESVIRNHSAYSDRWSEDFDSIEEAQAEADSLYFSIKEGYHNRFLLIEFCEIWEFNTETEEAQPIDIIL